MSALDDMGVDLKYVFAEQRLQGTMGVWAEPFTNFGCRRRVELDQR
jgi:arylsulfatase